jgi:cytochrome c oxidase cbb3-type subunit 3
VGAESSDKPAEQQGRESQPAKRPALSLARLWPRDWRLGAAAVVVLLGLAFLLARGLNAHSQYAQLLYAEPDSIAANVTLARFAEREARPLYLKHCASCHGAELKGDTARGVPNLADSDWLYGVGRIPEIEKTILYGIRSGHNRGWNLADMPAFGEATPYRRYKVNPLTPQQITDVIAYMRLLEGKPVADQASTARGAKVFADTGQCFDCHANDGAGDSAIGAPNLTDKVWLYGDGSDASVFKSIAHGHRGVCPAWTYRLKPGEVRALAVYLYMASHPNKPAGSKVAAAPSNREGKPS